MIIECDGVSQRYGRHYVFSSLDLRVDKGITVLLGPNGAGKTTLLDMVATLRPPAGGTLKVLGHDVDSGNLPEIRRRTGYLPQVMGYYGRFTVLEFVEYTTWLKGIPPATATRLATTALARVGLSGVTARRLSSLSGGMLRRAGIAQAIAHRPSLVILDEPSGGLDPGQRIGLRSLVKELSAETSFVISTHLVDDLRALADEVLVLSEGRVVFQGTAAELEGRASDGGAGDSPLERGYTSVLGPPR